LRPPECYHRGGDSPWLIVGSILRLLPYLRRYRRAYAIGFLSVVVTATLALLAPLVLQYAIDDLGRSITHRKLAFYAALLVGLALVGGVARFLMRRVVIGASRHVEAEVRDDFFAHLTRLPLAYFRSRRTGDLMARAMNDLESVRLMIGISVIDAANTAVVFTVAIALMLSIDAGLTAMALLPLPAVSLAVRWFGKAIHARFQLVQAQLSEVASLTHEGLSSVRLVRAYGQEDAHVARFADATRRYFARNRSLIRLQAAFYATMTFSLGVGALLVLWLGSERVVRGELTLGEFVALTAYQAMLGVPMVAIGLLTNTIQRGIASWKRMLEVFDESEAEGVPSRSGEGSAETPAHWKVEASSRPGAAAGLPRRGLELEFKNLTFSYGPGLPAVLRGVSFRAEPGQTVALVGATGSGKSTLLHLLPRLLEPPPGTVFVDGVDVRQLPLEILRRQIGFVPQEPFLFAETLAGNIAFAPAGEDGGGSARVREAPPTAVELLSGGFDLRGTGTFHLGPAVTDAVRRASAIARLDPEVEALPRGYETPLEERGLNLSGGQRQRTALARALVLDPPILVLDDALSAVDTRTEAEILEGLRGGAASRTTLVAASRLSTVREASLILFLDEGRIAERGTHAELVALGGQYAGLYSRQVLRESLEAG